MSNATDQARSTRSDARSFADAFAAADDAFTFGADAGESRELTLAELGDVLALDRPVALPAPREAKVPSRDTPAGPGPPADDDALLTLDELGDALARPAREADVVDFDFGTSADERARRRTAARLEASPSARRRISGPAAAPSSRSRRADVHARQAGDAARPVSQPGSRSASSTAMADAVADVAEHLAAPAAGPRFVRDGTGPSRLDAARALPVTLRPSDDFLADPDARRTIEITGRPAADVALPRLREVERRPRQARAPAERLGANPDRIAMWAVLLGILLILIAFTSGSASAVALPLLGVL